jgi:hypothetical protein
MVEVCHDNSKHIATALDEALVECGGHGEYGGAAAFLSALGPLCN